MTSPAGARSDARVGRRHSSLRTYLVALILLSTVPVATLLAYEVFQGIRQQQARLDGDLDLSARALAERVDHEIRAAASRLTALASSAALARGDLRGAADEFKRAQDGAGWLGVFIADPTGNLRLDTSAPIGTGPGIDAASAADPEIAVSAVLRHPAGGRRVVVVSVPVAIDGATGFRLGAWVDATAWRRVLESTVASTAAARVVFDQNGAVVTGSPRPGTERAPAAIDASALARRPLAGGAGERDLEGDGVRASRHGIDPWRWSVAVAVPAAPFATAQRRAFLVAISTGAACMLLGLSLGLLLARRLIQPLDALASTGLAADVTPSTILEIERLRERLQAAQAQHDAAMTRLEVKAAEFQALFDSSPIGLAFAQDRDGRSVVLNPAMQALFGVAPGDGRTRVLHDDVMLARSELPIYRAARSGEAVAAMELLIDNGDGRTPIAVLAQAVPLRDVAGVPRGAIGAAIDITRRKLDERRLAETEARLRENQHLIDLAQEAGQVGFFNHDFGAGRSSWSPGHARLFGQPPGTAAVLADSWAQVDPEHRPHMQNLMRQVLLLQQDKETFDYRIVRANGEARWMSSRILLQYGPTGQPQRMIGVTVDVSRHKLLELEREQLMLREQNARREAESANRAKDDFLAMLGHELRNPLGAISSAVEVLQRIDRNSPMASNALEIVGRQTRKLGRIMDELLDAAGVLSGQAALYRAPLDLARLTRAVVDAAGLDPAGAGRTVATRLEPAWADADAARIEQVVGHLLGNALKHTPPASHIEVVTEHDGDEVVLRVADRGGGMSPELLAAIFDPFVQGEQPLDRSRGGLGLGLTLVRRLTALHGGKVTARSGRTAACSRCACRRWKRRRTAALRTPRGSASTGAHASQRSVVLVEDNADAALALRTSLELDGHTVHSADDGLAGLAAIVGERPDVAIVDLGLPGLTGFDVALRSRAAGFPGLMIATSGYGQRADTERTRRCGFDAHLVKPLDAARLRELMATSV